MNISVENKITSSFSSLVIPFTDELILKDETLKLLASAFNDNEYKLVESALKVTLENGDLGKSCGSAALLNIFLNNENKKIVLVSLGNEKTSNREIFLGFSKALKLCKENKSEKTVLLLDNASEITSKRAVAGKICQLFYLVSYKFEDYKSSPKESPMKEAVIVTSMEGMEEISHEAAILGTSTCLARDLVNHPSMYMTASKFAEEAEKMALSLGIEARVYSKEEIEELKMGAFLSVAKGAVDEPKLIVLRYKGTSSDVPPIALVGKGVMFDSGGYTLKSKMATMHDDMGGAAAVVGAIRSIAMMKLPVNVVAVVAACKNMVSGDAYVPGDILFSMNGKTIEMLNADAEGRLTLADAITYAVRKENASMVIDIATLTGAAKNAVGGRSAAILSNDDSLAEMVEKAADTSCEKVWRLPCDEELFPVLRSDIADIKNSSPGNNYGGGTIVAGLFIREFVEDKPWCHVDMAPVNWRADGTSFSIKGATGYGAALLYETVKNLCK